MTDALFILNPRHIPECIQAIQALDIPKCWISYMPEPQAADAINHTVALTGFDRYLILSDDTTPTQHALDLIVRTADAGHPVVTGYCNLDEGDHSEFVNLTTQPLPPPPPHHSYYDFQLRTHIEQHPEGTPVPTTFAGLSLTLLPRDLLLEYPLHTTVYGGQMDYDLCHRLGMNGIPIVAPSGAYVHHVKERWGYMDKATNKRLLIGDRPAEITWDESHTPLPT